MLNGRFRSTDRRLKSGLMGANNTFDWEAFDTALISVSSNSVGFPNPSDRQPIRLTIRETQVFDPCLVFYPQATRTFDQA
jgi:hypothetical protein